MTPERWQRIEQVYYAALERAVEQRGAYLDEACAQDQRLRECVEQLLAANAQASSFLTMPPLEKELQPMAADFPALLVGQQINHYRILAQLGVGGMGEVWLAEDTSLGRKVALKLLPPQFTSEPGRLQRFIREAKTASALNHPNIITIYEIGQSGEIHFIATEFIEGITLRQRLTNGRMEVAEVWQVVRQISSALEAAHAAGIVHRDIKPENVMLRPDGLVKVLDFGLAKLSETRKAEGGTRSEEAEPLWQASSDIHRSSLSLHPSTIPGMIMGTPRYMSPEQARRQKVDARSDIFSFGVVCYEMMTGEPPFMGQNVADLFAALLSHDPLPLTHHVPTAPAQLNHIISKALAKDCAERYQTVRELQVDLQSLMTSISAAPPPLPAEDRTLLLTPTQNKAISTESAEKGMSNATTSLSGRLTASLTQPAVKISPLMMVVGLLVIVSLL